MALPKNWKTRFIESLRNTSNVRVACQSAGVTRGGAYLRRSKDAAFATAWDEALEDACDAMEAEAFRRGVHGTEKRKPIFHNGEKVGEYIEREYSDTLLIFMLKAHRPEKYRERYNVRHSGSITMTFAELAQLATKEDDE